jgi:hypothetical protein
MAHINIPCPDSAPPWHMNRDIENENLLQKQGNKIRHKYAAHRSHELCQMRMVWIDKTIDILLCYQNKAHCVLANSL